MPYSSNRQPFDYEPVTRSPRAKDLREGEAVTANDWLPRGEDIAGDEIANRPSGSTLEEQALPTSRGVRPESWIIRRGHAAAYAGLFLFTFVLYFRPYELFPALAGFSSMAFWIAILTFAAYLPTQLSLEGNLTARPREVNLLLLFCLTAVASIPLAINPGEAYGVFAEYIRPVIIFIVIINVVRTESRLKKLIWLSLAVSIMVGVGVINDFRLGNFADNRVWGSNNNLFGNPNDIALHLVTMVPFAVALLFATRRIIPKILYAMCAFLMVIATVVTFSRGGFLGLVGAGAVLAWKLGRRSRLAMIMVVFLFVGVFAFAPGGYSSRLGSIFDASKDASGSSSARQYLLTRSIEVALSHPVFGIGMGNFHTVSIHEQVSHNAYTQVASEMGFAALLLYVLFVVAPLRRLRSIERETFVAHHHSRFYYLAIGAQASLVAYMIASFFAAVAYQYYIYYLVGYAVCLHRLYQSERSAAQGGDERTAKNHTLSSSSNDSCELSRTF